MTPTLTLHHVIERLQQARERVASGWPSVALALAGTSVSTAQARLAEAADAVFSSQPPHPWVQVLMDAVLLVDEAREMWGRTPDTMPPMTLDLAPCGADLRLHLTPARVCAERNVAWGDPAGLTRPQALCVVHLAVCLAQWRAAEARADAAAAKAQAEVEQGRQERASTAAKAIWGPPPTTQRSEPRDVGPRSLRDLASVSAAFDQWTDDESQE